MYLRLRRYVLISQGFDKQNFQANGFISDTHGYYEKADATYDHRVRQKLHQRDVSEKILEFIRKSDNLMMLADQGHYNGSGQIGFAIFRADFL